VKTSAGTEAVNPGGHRLLRPRETYSGSGLACIALRPLFCIALVSHCRHKGCCCLLGHEAVHVLLGLGHRAGIGTWHWEVSQSLHGQRVGMMFGRCTKSSNNPLAGPERACLNADKCVDANVH
jgi:hypothetical protein